MIEPSCTATTKAGKACRSFALPGRDVCIMHDPDLAGQVQAARRKGGTSAAPLRLLQGRRLKLDSAPALTRFVSDLVQDILAGTVEPDVARTCLYGGALLRQLIETGDLAARLAALEASQAQQAPTRPAWGRR